MSFAPHSAWKTCVRHPLTLSRLLRMHGRLLGRFPAADRATLTALTGGRRPMRIFPRQRALPPHSLDQSDSLNPFRFDRTGGLRRWPVRPAGTVIHPGLAWPLAAPNEHYDTIPTNSPATRRPPADGHLAPQAPGKWPSTSSRYSRSSHLEARPPRPGTRSAARKGGPPRCGGLRRL